MSVSQHGIPSVRHLQVLFKNALNSGGQVLSTLSQFAQANRAAVLGVSATTAAAVPLIFNSMKGAVVPPSSFDLKAINPNLGQVINQLPAVIPIVLLVAFLLSCSSETKMNCNTFALMALLSTSLTASAAILVNAYI